MDMSRCGKTGTAHSRCDMLTARQRERYSRHIMLPNFGTSAQELLLKSHVAVIGAGGLGCPVLQYLAAAGVGKITVIDGDLVELSNLQRQVLFTTADIGKKKALCAANRLSLLNEDVQFIAYAERLTS